MSAEVQDIIAGMKSIRLTTMAEYFRAMTEDANFGLKSSLEVLDELITNEQQCRRSRKMNRLLSKAHLKYPAAAIDDSLQEPDRKIDCALVRRLSEAKWIDEKKNLIITGKAGTGKTFIACALAVCAIHKGREVLYTKASAMINELNESHFSGDYSGKLKQYVESDLLVIDDFGLMSLEISHCLQLFEVLDAREGVGSILVISQLPVRSWYDTFQNNVYADACMSRLIHNSYRLDLEGRDMRKNGVLNQ